jgi:hypothetical protein
MFMTRPLLPAMLSQIGVRAPLRTENTSVHLTKDARATLASLDPGRRAVLSEGFRRVGNELLASAERVSVDATWAHRTWPRRRYPQQCYAKTLKYVFEHAEIGGMRLVHGVAAHVPHLVPFEHAWVELPGDVVFDGVVQTFFSRASYYVVMTPVLLDAYSAREAAALVTEHGHPGPWNAKWVPTPDQLAAYLAAVALLRGRSPPQAAVGLGHLLR